MNTSDPSPNQSDWEIMERLFSPEVCTEVGAQICLDALLFVFRDKALKICGELQEDSMRVFFDQKLRKKYDPTNLLIYRNGNPRESRLPRKTGRIDLYLNGDVFTLFRQSKELYRIFCDKYQENQLACYSIDAIILKPPGAEMSTPAMYQTNPAVSSSTYVAFICIASSEKPENSGELYIYEHFDLYFDDILNFLELPRKIKKSNTLLSLTSIDPDQINDHLSTLYSNPRQVRWKRIDMKAGDVIILNTKIPFRTGKNTSPSTRIFLPIMLEPENDKKNKVCFSEGNVIDSSGSLKNLDEHSWRASLPADSPFSLKSVIRFTDVTEIGREIFFFD